MNLLVIGTWTNDAVITLQITLEVNINTPFSRARNQSNEDGVSSRSSNYQE